jgi:fumarylacetoacetase
MIDHTHDPALQSWVPSASEAGCDFPIQNLPLGVVRHADGKPVIAIAIGDRALDLPAALASGALVVSDDVAAACGTATLNALMALGRDASRQLRHAVSAALADSATPAVRAALAPALLPLAEVQPLLPADIGDYTDFYASAHHATNVGSMFRPDNPLLPNYKYVPIGYHGRASSIVATGTDVRRPHGQLRPDPAAPPVVGPTMRLDYELEVGAFIARGNPMGQPFGIGDAEERLFGLVLVNDWSARDIQAWEYQPLGPFLAKNFATTVSPWVVTMEALEPFRAPRAPRPEGDPAPLPYLSSEADASAGAVDITLEVLLSSARMRQEGVPPMPVSRGSFTDMYWTLAQMVTHHASSGCNLRPGDLVASGTVSGSAPESRGCLLERTWRGEQPLELPTGERRAFLEDGDEVSLRGWCQRPGAVRIGFGPCVGRVDG